MHTDIGLMTHPSYILYCVNTDEKTTESVNLVTTWEGPGMQISERASALRYAYIFPLFISLITINFTLRSFNPPTSIPGKRAGTPWRGGGICYYSGTKKRTASKVTRQWALVLLTKVGWKQGKVFVKRSRWHAGKWTVCSVQQRNEAEQLDWFFVWRTALWRNFRRVYAKKLRLFFGRVAWQAWKT